MSSDAVDKSKPSVLRFHNSLQQQQMDSQRQVLQQSNMLSPNPASENGPVFGTGSVQIN
jgi:intracellular multiplication protein IcmE